MAAPKFKMYDDSNVFQGAAVTLGIAASMMAGCGSKGWTVRYGHSIKSVLWTEGEDGHAKEHDHCVKVMGGRMSSYVKKEKANVAEDAPKAPLAAVPKGASAPKPRTVKPAPKTAAKPQMSKAAAAKKATAVSGK